MIKLEDRLDRFVLTLRKLGYKRRYPKLFINKLTDSAGESGETEVWIDFSFDHKYINEDQKNRLSEKYTEVGKMLNSMIRQPEKFCY